MKTFPKLYKKSSKGALQIWDVLVEDNEIVVTHGLQDGKKQTDRKMIKEGKNAGKENETTAQEQAEFEAESKWKKQLDKGYVDDIADVDTPVYLPMLAQTFSKLDDKTGKEKGRKKHIKYPCYIQRKFDGVRCFGSINKNGEVVLESRKGKQFPHMEHLFNQVKSIANAAGLLDIIIDGELYSDEIPFQRLVGLVKRKTLKEGDLDDMKKIKIRVYDCVIKSEPELGFEKRYNYINKIVTEDVVKCSHLVMVENFHIQSENEIRHLHDKFVAEGYEGVIIRNKEGKYALNKRSNDLQKFKYFADSEYKIVGAEECVGRAAGTVIWVCEEPKSKSTFKVRPTGTETERAAWWNESDKFHGQMLTVRYQELTDDGIPRFPVGIAIRNYE